MGSIRRGARWSAVILSIAFNSLWAADCERPLGRMVSVEGDVQVGGSADGAWLDAAPDGQLCHGDFVRSGANSRGGVYLAEVDTVVRLDQNTMLRVSAPAAETSGYRVEVRKGLANVISRDRQALNIQTPFAQAVGTGSEFLVAVAGERSTLTVYDGALELSNALGRLQLEGGQSAVAAGDAAPAFIEYIKPDDAVQWAMHYEPVLAALLASGRQDRPEELVLAFHGGLSMLDLAAPSVEQADFFNYRAALYLSVGRVDKAEPDLQLAGSLEPNNADTLAIRSVIALGRNRKDEALSLAERASGAGPQRVLPWLALSYARQGHFDLAGAEAAVESGLRQDPRNGLIQARLAELMLARGELAAADRQIHSALEAAPEAALVHRTIGFSHLLHLELEAAETAFRGAIERDQSDPMARLGLGLTLLRAGDLQAGREEMEIAIGLAPRNSLLRSYLGQAYFEENRDELALGEYDLAAALDPKDPTPWLYRG